MRIAIDTGGTFTDCVFLRGGRLEILKVFSTPANPARAITQAVADVRRRLGERTAPVELLHGTTVGTNALLERRGGRVALVTTEGFEDVLVIGRQARPELYNFFVQKPPPLVDAVRRLGVRERISADGRVLVALTPPLLARLKRRVRKLHPQSVAVCLLFSYVNPAHERRLARALRSFGLPVSVSHEILPEFREYERTSTVAVNAYLAPVMGRYLAEVETVAGRKGKVGVMQSSGGTVSARVASAQPVRTLLSGPAGGVVGAQAVAERAGFDRIISFDMGGTSTDVALLSCPAVGGAGALATTNEGSVGGVPVAVPMLDIHTVGAGGGSLAWFDEGGALRVGPQSAGADPGPICYGKGRQPTVTDAHLILGRLDPNQFLGGEWRLDAERTHRYTQPFLRREPGLRRLEELAAGIVAVANATMERAIRVISVERGHDPREFTLVAFGGAGGLHACDLAAALGIPRIVVPKFPGALSALGILCSDVVKDYSRTVLWPVDRAPALAPKLETAFRQLERTARADLAREGFPRAAQRLLRQLDLRYRGQAFELTVPYSRDFVHAFHQAHARRYGYSDPSRPIEVVNVRLRALGLTTKPALRARRPAGTEPPSNALFKRDRAYFDGNWRATNFYVRERLRSGNRLRGPAVIAEYSGTTVLPPGWRARVDTHENLLLER